jgi:hypothetical protein
MMRPRYLLHIIVLGIWASAACLAQTAGRITGTVIDQTQQVIVGAAISLINEGTGQTSTTTSTSSGAFVFPSVQAGTYTIRVQAQGFSVFERNRQVLNAGESLALGDLPLTVGTVSEKVTVEAQGAAVQTDSSNQTAVLTTNQLGGLMSRGRDIVSLMTVLPGVSQNTGSDALGGNWGTNTPNMQGMRNHWNTFLLDGQPGSDIDVLSYFTISVSMDSISEVAVKQTSYLAEEGRNPGVHVNIVSKSGTKEFHGSAYWFKRHEMFNANNFFNNRLGIDKPLTRYNTYGGVLGGPVYIPKVWNTSKDKLFFFFSEELWRIQLPGPLLNTTLPTELERRGDFSRSFDQNGALIQVIDPSTGQPFPGNVIPSNRINRFGQAMLNWHPMPNIFDLNITRGAFNYRFQERRKQPKTQTQLKLDWLPTAKDRISFRPRWWNSDIRGQESSTAFQSNFFAQPHHYEYVNNAYNVNYTRTFSPTVVNDFTFAYGETGEIGALNDEFSLANVRREKYGLEDLGQLFPETNPLGLIPQQYYTGLANAPFTQFDPRTPIDAFDQRFLVTNNVSWVRGAHNLKFGFFYELNNASEGPRASAVGKHMGSFDFRRDRNNPLDSNHPFANALLGNFYSYSESSGMTDGRAQIWTVEWFAQDSWRVNRRLNLDLGVRFYKFIPWRLRDDEGAALSLQRYDPASVARLYEPVLQNGQRVALNPITGQTAPAPMIGAFVPDSGDRLSGTVLGSDDSYPSGFRESPPIQIGPRFGFAYDIFGTGKTALRGGFAVNKQTIFSSQNSMWTVTTAPPILESPNIFYGTIDSFLSAGQVTFPTDATAFDLDYDKTATVYQWSFGIQQDLGAGTVLDATYTGNTGRHLRQNRNVNVLPPGTRFLPSSLDSTTGRPLPDTFLRPYRGYQNVQYLEDSGYSNYNALQLAVNRRYTSGLQFGLAYTYSKAMGISDNDAGGLPIYRDYRSYLYGKLGYDQTHIFVANYLYSLPNLQALGTNAFARAVFHNWEIAGITTFASGFPMGVNFSYTDGVDRWGGGDAPRVNMVAKPILDRSERSFARWFNTGAVAAPGRLDFGNAPRDVFRGPGINSWDFTIQKDFPVTERSRFQLRWEFYNLFNHTQWSAVDNNARFDSSGQQVNGQFGQITGARLERQMQGSLRFEF